jgi:hypothetical protein
MLTKMTGEDPRPRSRCRSPRRGRGQGLERVPIKWNHLIVIRFMAEAAMRACCVANRTELNANAISIGIAYVTFNISAWFVE